MSDKFVVSTNTVGEIIVTDTETGNVYHYGSMSNFLGLIRLLNEQQATINQLKEENMDLRANHTQMIIIMKDVVRDLKRMDTYRYAEHLEKIANLRFLSEKELEDEETI